MEAAFHVNIIDQCHVFPEPNSDISQVTIPLTYFDIPWLFYSPNQTLFFYKIAQYESAIANLKKSLSLALHQFYPLAGNLVVPPPPAEPHIVYTKGDSVPFFVAESNKDISYLSGDHPRNVTSLSSLVPKLPSPSSISLETRVLPLFAIQITLFGDSGLSIGVTSQHAACDERTLYAFMKCWTSFYKSLLKNESFLEFTSIPWFDRSVILDPTSLKTRLLEQWKSTLNSSLKDSHKETKHDIVQTTFFLSSSDINTIKDHIVAKCVKVKEDPPLNLSLYETGVCYTWICLLKVQETLDTKGGPIYMGYNASGISRLKYEIPFSYFGCCIVFGRFGALKSELLGEDGLVCATRSFDKEIDRLVRDFLEGGEKWISDWSELNLRIIGSPKVDFYGVDFGWGKAEKIEKISGDNHGRVDVITLNGGKDLDGGLEIGVVLPRDKISEFTTLFNNGLKELAR
ncbi:anthocyanin 5-aromatic acyltransferase-like protein [Tanacetum coccineum]|uniref:Anthocyanin 5-aromatic acyltransferase-like protein n=1 Tax=Tanacetum coccineum TaxID=301880 RepID=A0ABQ5E6S2_9ASTR